MIHFPNGAQGRNRTTDTRIFSPLLYQLSYLGLAPFFLIEPCGAFKTVKMALKFSTRPYPEQVETPLAIPSAPDRAGCASGENRDGRRGYRKIRRVCPVEPLTGDDFIAFAREAGARLDQNSDAEPP
jgi:hypothetical protein